MLNPEPGLNPDEIEDLIGEKEIAKVPWTVADVWLGVILLVPVSLVIWVILYAAGLALTGLLGEGVPIYLQIVSLGGATFIAGIGLAWWLGIKRRGGNPANLGFTNLRLWFDATLAALSEIVVFIAWATYALILLKLADLRVPEQPIIQSFGPTRIGFVMAVVSVAILAPIGEEVFFRGFVYTGLRRRWGAGKAMVISSSVFALFHLSPLLYVPMFIMGLVLAAIFEYRHSLAPNIILHAVNNFLALFVIYSRG